MSGEENSGLESTKFKNIGIDTDFIQQNANEYNDKISELYHGGKEPSLNETKQEQVPTVEAGESIEDIQSEELAQPQETVEQATQIPQAPAEQPAQNAQPGLHQAHVEQIADAKVLELAKKMQAYANETDQKIAALESRIVELQKQQPPQQKLVVEEKQQPKKDGSQMASSAEDLPAEADVSIEKMFDFSNNKSGQRQ